MMNKCFYWLFSILFALLISAAFSAQGGFQDSLIYYEQFMLVKNLGVYETLNLINLQSGKFEPGIIFIFYIQSFFIDSQSSFLFINLLMINLLLVNLYFLYNEDCSDSSNLSLLALVLLLFSYYTFANYIYIWRSVYSFYFIALYCLSIKKKHHFVFLILAFIFHLSSVVYILLYLLISRLHLSKLGVISISFFISIFILMLIFSLPETVSLLTSGNGVNVFLTLDVDIYTILRRALIALLFTFILLIYSPPEKLQVLYNLILMLSILSIIFSFNAQLSWRIFSPAAILGTVLLINASHNRVVIYSLLLISTIPSLRIIYLFSTGQFHAS